MCGLESPKVVSLAIVSVIANTLNRAHSKTTTLTNDFSCFHVAGDSDSPPLAPPFALHLT